MLHWPPKPPTQILIDMLRTRGAACPAYGPVAGRTVDLSDGHFQMPMACPQYRQRGLFLMSRSTSQFERLSGSKSMWPRTQTYGSFAGSPSELANNRRS